jgi:hypothetical protein
MEFIQARNYTRVGSPPRSIDVVVLHTMEYPERPTGAEWCANYFAGQNAPQASAHYMVDNDTVVQGVRDEDVAWAAPGCNHNGLQIEHAGFAAQKAPEWEDAYSRAMLRLSARLTAKLCKRHAIPVRYVDSADLRVGRRGITTHAAVSEAFKKSSHWDPGPSFPMADYIAAVKAVTLPVPVVEVEIVKPWIPLLFHWYLNERKPGVERPSMISGVPIPPPPWPQEFWAMVESADIFRAAKPDGSSAEAAALRAKIAAAKAALG